MCAREQLLPLTHTGLHSGQGLVAVSPQDCRFKSEASCSPRAGVPPSKPCLWLYIWPYPHSACRRRDDPHSIPPLHTLHQQLCKQRQALRITTTFQAALHPATSAPST